MKVGCCVMQCTMRRRRIQCWGQISISLWQQWNGKTSLPWKIVCCTVDCCKMCIKFYNYFSRPTDQPGTSADVFVLCHFIRLGKSHSLIHSLYGCMNINNNSKNDFNSRRSVPQQSAIQTNKPWFMVRKVFSLNFSLWQKHKQTEMFRHES